MVGLWSQVKWKIEVLWLIAMSDSMQLAGKKVESFADGLNWGPVNLLACFNDIEIPQPLNHGEQI